MHNGYLKSMLVSFQCNMTLKLPRPENKPRLIGIPGCYCEVKTIDELREAHGLDT